MIDLRTAIAVVAAQLVVLAMAGGAVAAPKTAPGPASKPANAAAPKSAPGQAATASAAPAGCADATAIPTNSAMRAAAATAVLCLVNAERAQRGLTPVVSSSRLNRAATSHSTDMVRRKYFDHVSPSGQDLRARVARTGYLRGSRSPSLGETIAWGSDLHATPGELVKDLMNSPEHRSIILGRFRHVGVGLALGAPMDGMGASGATLSLNFGRR